MFGVYKALYDYTPQDPETELALVEGQVLYILVKEDEEWWKAKTKTDGPDEEGTIGLVPSNYLEESGPISRARAIYAYEAANNEELTIGEDDLLQVYEKDDEWLLVKVDGGEQLGYVPANYVQEEEGSGGDGFIAAAEAEEVASPVAAEYMDPSDRVAAGRDKAKADAIQTWVVSEVDKKKKKKKGTLGVGNGAVFFASESDKNPIQQYPISTVSSVSQDAKLVYLTVTTVPTSPIQFHCSSSSEAEAIVAKLHASKEAAGGASLNTTSAPAHPLSDEDEPSLSISTSSTPKAVRWAPSPVEPETPTGGAEEAAIALYDFDADPNGDDELSVREGERLTVLDKTADEDWWRVRNAAGKEGVVPAQYVELSTGGDADAIPDNDSDDEREAQAVAAANAEKEAAGIRAEAERAERDADEKRERQRAEDKRRRREDERTRKEEEARRREEARRAAPAPEAPKIRHRPSEQDVNAARKIDIPKGRGLPDRPSASSSGKTRPSEARTRIWHDKSGQFKVEAEFLGFKGGKIRLHKLNGVVIEVPLEKMSPEDMDYIERVTGRKQHRTPPNDDDIPLAHSVTPKSRATSSVSRDNAGRSSPAVAARPAASRKPRIDWFEFFLSAGCDMDDCTRYSNAFERDKIDESILPDIESSTLRSIGLREGDIIRVKKAISARNPPKEKKQQIESDEAYARRLQEEENGGGSSRGATSSPSPGLFTSAGGALKNNTRRGRPERAPTASSVDAAAIASASSQLSRNDTPPITAPRSPSPPPAPKAQVPAPAVSNGFDDDAWTPRPSSTKPTTPAPPIVSPPPPQISAPAPTPPTLVSFNSSPSIPRPTSANPQASSSFDYLAQLGLNRAPSAPIQQPINTGMSNMSIGSTGSSGFQPNAPPAPQSYHNGLGFNNSQAPMGQLLQNQQTGAFQPQQQQQQQGPRGPLAPVPGNQSLLSPLIPTSTGLNQFIPTRLQASPSNFLSPQATGFPQQQQPQQTGYPQQPQATGFQQPQPTGYGGGYGGAGGGFAQPQGGFMSTQQTGLNPNFIQGQVNANANALSSADQFNSLASARVQPTPRMEQQNFNPSNVFASMKGNKGMLDPSAAPQSENKYDALRPQATGFPGMQQQPTGFMQPQQSGFMQPQQTGFPMQMGGFQQPQQQFPQPTGFVQPAFNPYGQQPQQQQQQGNYRGF
ncbi:hypothetical protein BDY24DRAFT_384558 [Mrakia frigida]|uniref:uncharacterized protein n=1 Tax=Mrakia frigida TaxID=29902 RepID=UPI003FCBF429